MRSVSIKYLMGADLTHLFKLLLLVGVLCTLSRAYLCALFACLLIIFSYCERTWWRPWFEVYVQRHTADTRQALGASDLPKAGVSIARFAWVRLFGHHAVILELMGHYALGMNHLDDAVGYFNRALMDTRGDEGVDAHFGILQARLLTGDLVGAQQKADELRRKFKGDAFVGMRIDLLTQSSN